MSRTYEEILKEVEKSSASALASQKQSYNNTYDTQIQNVKSTYGAEAKTVEQKYNQMLDENNVQRIINERQIAENMANSGLTDSGLNRTQMTASQLSHANNKARIERQKRAGLDVLNQAVAAQVSEIEANRQSTLAGLEAEYAADNRSTAASMCNAEQEAAAEEAKAALEAITATQKQQDSDFKSVMSVMGNANATPALKEQWQRWYGTRYGLDGDALTELFGSTSAKTAYTTDELSSGVTSSGSQVYTKDMISEGVSDRVASNENPEQAVNYAQRIASENGWDETTMYSFYDAISNQTESIRAFGKNPTLLKYTLVSQPKNDTYTGDIANTAVVRDQFGVERTIEDVYYMTKVMHAKSEAEKFGEPNNWEKYVNTSAVKKAAKAAIKKIQENLGIKKK